MRGARILFLFLAVAGCGDEPPQTAHHATDRRDALLLKAEAHARTPALAAGPALARRADEIEATALLRKRLGKSAVLTAGERQVVVAAQTRSQSGKEATSEQQLRAVLGPSHKGKLISTR